MFNDLEQLNWSAASQTEMAAKWKQFMRVHLKRDYLK